MKKIFLILALLITAQHAINSSALPLPKIEHITRNNRDPLYDGLTKSIPSFKKWKNRTKKYVYSQLAWLNKKTDWCRKPTKKELKEACKKHKKTKSFDKNIATNRKHKAPPKP